MVVEGSYGVFILQVEGWFESGNSLCFHLVLFGVK